MGSCRDGQPREGACTVANKLTRDEARDRARLLEVQSYRIELDLTGGETTFRSRTTVAFRAASPGASSFIDLTAPQIREITLNGSQVSPENFTGHRIILDDLAGINELMVAADCAYSRTGEGLHRFTDPADKSVYLYSDLEARFEFPVPAPDPWLVVSNMAPDTSGAPAGPGAQRWHFPATPPMSSYITAIAAGPYHEVRADHDGIPLGIYCRQSLAGYLDPDEIFEVTRQGFDFFHDSFGVRYPFG